MTQHPTQSNQLPPALRDYIKSLINQTPFSDKVCEQIRIKLINHYTNALSDCKTNEEKNAHAQTLIQQTIDPKFLAKLMRRARKRSRPIWKKIRNRIVQAIVALVLLFCLYTIWFVTGKPNITIDYVAKLNQMARPDAPDDQNAWPHYQNAIEKYVEPDEAIKQIILNFSSRQVHVSLSPKEQQAIGDWIASNENAWAEYATAGNKEHFWYDYKIGFTNQDDQMWVTMPQPPPGDMKELSKLGIWKARQMLQQGNSLQALDHCLAIVRTGRHLQDASILIEQLVGVLISRLAHNEILYIIYEENIPAQQLSHVYDQLIETYQENYPLIKYDFERMIFLDFIQRAFTDGGPGGGHLLPVVFNDNFSYGVNESNLALGVELNIRFVAQSMIHARRKTTLDHSQRIYDMIDRETRLTPYQIDRMKDPTVEDYYFKSLSLPRNYFIYLYVYPSGRASEMAWQCKAIHDATLTVLALHRWKLQKGFLPDSLEELIEAGLLERLPLDPYSEGPLTYKKHGDDFILYSYAGDFDDDQGWQNPENLWADKRPWAARAASREESGDHLFWPPSY